MLLVPALAPALLVVVPAPVVVVAAAAALESSDPELAVSDKLDLMVVASVPLAFEDATRIEVGSLLEPVATEPEGRMRDLEEGKIPVAVVLGMVLVPVGVVWGASVVVRPESVVAAARRSEQKEEAGPGLETWVDG